MTCEEALWLLSGHLDQENTAEEEAQLQAHLETCHACVRLLKGLEENDKVLRALEAEPPRDLKEDIMEAIRRETVPKKRTPRCAWATVAVAAALALVVGNGFLRQAQKGIAPEAKHMESRAVEAAADQPEVNAAVAGAQVFAASPPAPVTVNTLSDETCQALANEYGAPVVVLLDSRVEDIPELIGASVCVPAQSVEESDTAYCMYTLETAHTAEDLCEEYGGTLFLPMTEIQDSKAASEDRDGVSYVLLAGE